MNAVMITDLSRIALVDPSDFTPPYDLALAGALQAEGRHVRLVGQAAIRPMFNAFITAIFTLFWPRRGDVDFRAGSLG